MPDTQQSANTFPQRRSTRVWWFAIAIATVVGGASFRFFTHRTSRLDEIALAYGSVGQIYQLPQANHDGSRITFYQVTEYGFGIILLDTATGRRRIVHEENEKDGEVFIKSDLRGWPWSPDDKFFAYSNKGEIVVCNADTGKESARVSCDNDRVAGLVWITPNVFAYVSRVQRSGNLHIVTRNADGHWEQADLDTIKADAADLVAISTNTVAWQHGDSILSATIGSPKACFVYISERSGLHLTGFNYSKQTGELLLNCTENGEDSLWRLSYSHSTDSHAIRIQSGPSIRNAKWIGRKGGFIYASSKTDDTNDMDLVVQTNPAIKPLTLFNNGDVAGFAITPDGGQLLVVGIVGEEPARGIWRYDFAKAEMRSIVPCTDHPSSYAKRIDAKQCFIDLPSGRRITYWLYEPKTFDHNRKCPLILADTPFHFRPSFYDYDFTYKGPVWPPALANCGAYVAIVDRPGWQDGMEHWEEDVMSVYSVLVKNAMVNSHKCFLVGICEETSHLNLLVEQHRDFWSGLILIEPPSLPDPLGISNPKTAVFLGQLQDQVKQFKNYEEGGGKVNPKINIVLLPHARHGTNSRASFYVITQTMIDFIFDE